MELFERTKPHANVHVMGAKGHGTTELVAAILQNRAQAGMLPSSETATQEVVEFETEAVHYALFDHPHDEDFATQATHIDSMDYTIVVISGKSRIVPELRKQLAIWDAFKTSFIVFYLSQLDGMSAEMFEEMKSEILQLFEDSGIPDNSFVIPETPFTSDSEAIPVLLEILDNDCRGLLPGIQGSFKMGIRKVVGNSPQGTLVQGIVNGGSVKTGDHIQIIGMGRSLEASIAQMRIFQRQVDNAIVRDYVELCLTGVNEDLLVPGMCAFAAGALFAHHKFIFEGVWFSPQLAGAKREEFAFMNLIKGEEVKLIIGPRAVSGKITAFCDPDLNYLNISGTNQLDDAYGMRRPKAGDRLFVEIELSTPEVVSRFERALAYVEDIIVIDGGDCNDEILDLCIQSSETGERIEGDGFYIENFYYHEPTGDIVPMLSLRERKDVC